MIKRLLLVLICCYIFAQNGICAIDIVYPSQKRLTINSNETFFSGNVDDNCPVYINGQPVKLYNNRYFVEMVPLKYGENKIVIQSKTDQKTFFIKRLNVAQTTTAAVQTNSPSCNKIGNGMLFAKTNNNRSTLRDKPSSSGNRVIELKEGVFLYFDGIKNDYYHLALEGADLWIHKSNIDDIENVAEIKYSHLKKHKHYDDDLYYYDKFYFSHPVPYTIVQDGNSIKITFYNLDNSDCINHKYEYVVKPNVVLGYDCIVEHNAIVLRYAKQPKISSKISPLKGINIFIDAGHGGSELGTIGPERVFEKDITLSIASTLIKLLQAEGANVYFSRLDDSKVDLYKRVDIANENAALISISIHTNSLPYGKNPYIKHGCEVHYYNDNAKYLAQIIQTNLSNDLNLKPNGVIKSGFALTRSTNPVSVLVETAYMLNPNEYEILKNPVNQRNMAKSIRNSLEQYIISISKND